MYDSKSLEIVSELSTESLLLCLRKFSARRGSPRVIMSDNAKQFVLCFKMLKEKFKEDFNNTLFLGKFNNFLSKKGISWQFITERAPWRGGFYERLMSLLKHHLKRTLGNKLISKEKFEAIVIEIEFIINNRPITPIIDTGIHHLALRSIDFLLRNQLEGDPLLMGCEKDIEIN